MVLPEYVNQIYILISHSLGFVKILCAQIGIRKKKIAKLKGIFVVGGKQIMNSKRISLLPFQKSIGAKPSGRYLK
ncbi:MAG: hypothetical protein RQ728_02035 [Brevefilum sp.]|nr:hypothetical protein [Brevefilum sp.]MDT8381020.1 hypothetical protein [Brevefilum sp.]